MSCCTSDGCPDITLEDKSYNGTHRIQFPIQKDGVAWEGIDSVTYTFLAPDGTSFDRSAVESGTPGTWYYDTVSGDLNQVGYWRLAVTAVDGSINIEYPANISFRVVPRR